MQEYKNVTVLDHPLIRHKLAIIRNKNTDTKQFREVVEELAMLMAYESFKDVPTQEIEVETPLEKVKQTVAGRSGQRGTWSAARSRKRTLPQPLRACRAGSAVP